MCRTFIKYAIAAILIGSVFPVKTKSEDFLTKTEWFEWVSKNPQPAYGPTDDPPPQPAISPAEWEPMSGVMIAFPLQLADEMIAELTEDTEVMSLVRDEIEMQDAINYYTRIGVNLENCTFMYLEEASLPHPRDYGPWYIINGNDEQGMVDPIYWIPLCDNVPQIIGDSLGIPVYEIPLQAEGGNYMSDGIGTAISTDNILDANSQYTPVEVYQLAVEYLGITNYITVPDPWPPFPEHIDCSAKLLDPGRIIVCRTDPVNPILESNTDYFETLMSGYGRPYEVIRIDGRGYTNSLFLNNKIFVPLFNSPFDSLALDKWADVMPGYEIHGFFYDTYALDDAIHCRTMGITDRYMHRIVHVPIHDCENIGSDYLVTANIHPYSNEPLVVPPQIYWKTEGGIYNAVFMTNISGDDYEGYIPQQPDGSDILYYIEAEDGSGRVENHPYIGPGNPHHFHVGPDNEPPIVEFDPPDEITVNDWPLRLYAYALDNRWISYVTLEWMINGTPLEDIDMPLEAPYAVYYSCLAIGEIQPGDVIEVRIKAVDTAINQNTTYAPPSDYHVITVEGTGIEPQIGSSEIPTEFALYPAYPNPFNPLTTLRFDLPEEGKVSLIVYDIQGREVSKLVNAFRNAGNYEIFFNATDLSSGVYFARLETGDFQSTVKLLLMK